MRFVVDAQLPPVLARRLETFGHTAEHVADRGMASGSDHVIRDYAADSARRLRTPSTYNSRTEMALNFGQS